MIELQRVNLKEISKLEPALTGGHRLCAGCGAGTMARQVTLAAQALGEPFMIVNATGCLEVATTIYPYNSWTVPWLHNAFENAAATASGTIVALEALRRKKQLEYDQINILIFGGDGGTYDIGLQSLSGAIERGHDFLYVCYNNGAYMNCLSLDTYIMTEDGLKRVIEIQLGDLVYAFDQTTGDLVLKECSGIYDNGTKEVYELKTLHHSIKTTLNHPFLTVQRSRKKNENALIWKTLEQLELGDEIIVLKKLTSGKSYTFKKIIKHSKYITMASVSFDRYKVKNLREHMLLLHKLRESGLRIGTNLLIDNEIFNPPAKFAKLVELLFMESERVFALYPKNWEFVPILDYRDYYLYLSLRYKHFYVDDTTSKILTEKRYNNWKTNTRFF